MSQSPPASKALALWVPPRERPEAVAARAHEAKLQAAKNAEAEARLAVAETKKRHAEMLRVGSELVLGQLQKWLRMAADPDYANVVGPLEPKVVLQLAEFVTKNYRLDTGQATENVAHAVRASIDFSKLTQEERDRWRELAMKGGGGGEE